MSNVQIPNLPVAIALNGTEALEAVQSGTSVQTTVAGIAQYSYAYYPGFYISQLPAASSANSTDILPVLQGSTGPGTGTTRKITPGQLSVTATGSTTSRTFANRFADMINVKDFGAVGDGVADDTAAIQAAINAGSFRTVYFPIGVYRTTTEITQGASPNNVRLVGAGEFNTTIKRDTDGHVFNLTNVGFWVLEQLSIQHNTGLTSGVGIYFGGTSSSNQMTNCLIVNNPGGGASFVGASFFLAQSENKISNCLFLDNGRNGVGAQLRMEFTNDFLIANCDFGRQGTMTGYPAHGVYMLGASNGLYTDCEHWENTRAFETAGACNYNRITGNRWEESQQENVVLGGTGAYWQITDNVQYSAGKAAIDTYAGFVLADTVSNGTLQNLTSFSFDPALYRQTYGLTVAAGVTGWKIGGQKQAHYQLAPFLSLAAAGANVWTDAMIIGISADNVAAAGTSYITQFGARAGSSLGLTHVPRAGVIVEAGWFSLAAPGAGQSYNYTMYVNGVWSSPVSAFFSSGAGSFGGTSIVNVLVSANSTITNEIITSATAAVTSHRGYVLIVPT